jgi:soluble lytic murein transglycosylase
LTRWMGARGSMMNDPLLFIESIPASQTRDYVKRVLTYYWMYARRNGAEAPTLDATAAGKWPKYSGGSLQEPAANTLVSDATIPR